MQASVRPIARTATGSALALRRWWMMLCAAASGLLLVASSPVLADTLRLLEAGIEDPPLQQVLSGALDRHFTRELPHEVVLEPSRTTRWLRVDVAHQSAGDRVLAIGRLPMQRLEVFVPQPGGGYRGEQRSFFTPDPRRFSPSAFVFPLPDSVDRPLYIRVEHGGRLFLDVAVVDESRFRDREQRYQMSITAAFTTLGVMLLVNLVFLLALRERLYGYYVAFLATQMAWVLFSTGVGFGLPGLAALGQWPGSISGMLVTLANALMLQFARHFADLPHRHPRFDRALRWLIFAFLALSLAFVLPVDHSSRWVGAVASSVFAVLPLLLLGAMLRAWLAGSRSAGLFLIAWLPLGAIGALRTLVSFGLLPPTLGTLYGPLFAVAFESVVLSLALAWRMLELRIQRDRAQFLADYDVLTGGLSRRAGEQALGRMQQHADEQRGALSLVFFDLDHLKEINDVRGHSAGDISLCELGMRVRQVLGEQGKLVRWGGDEFLLLLPGMRGGDARELAQRLCEAIHAVPVDVPGASLTLGISAGVASHRHGDDLAALLERADRALLEAKRQGRNRVVCADSDAAPDDRPWRA